MYTRYIFISEFPLTAIAVVIMGSLKLASAQTTERGE